MVVPLNEWGNCTGCNGVYSFIWKTWIHSHDCLYKSNDTTEKEWKEVMKHE